MCGFGRVGAGPQQSIGHGGDSHAEICDGHSRRADGHSAAQRYTWPHANTVDSVDADQHSNRPTQRHSDIDADADRHTDGVHYTDVIANAFSDNDDRSIGHAHRHADTDACTDKHANRHADKHSRADRDAHADADVNRDVHAD